MTNDEIIKKISVNKTDIAKNIIESFSVKTVNG